MKNSIWIGLGLLFLIAVGLGLSSATLSAGETAEGAAPRVDSADNCWFRDAKGFDKVSKAVIEKRQAREIYGYPEEISIAEALKIYNQEQSCSPDFRSELTEDEILSSLAIPIDYGREDSWKLQREVFRKVLLTRTLPKGSLLVNEGAGIYRSPVGGESDEISIKGERIYLFLGLDRNPREANLLTQDQIVLIKKSVFGLKGL